MTHPQEDCKDDHNGSGRDDGPGNGAFTVAAKISTRWPDIFDARQVQVRKLFDLDWGLRFRGCFARFVGVKLASRGSAGGIGADGLPDFLSADLRLAEADKIVGNGLVGIEAEMLGIGADESFIENTAGKLIEVFFFDGLEHARADLGDVGDVIEGEVFFLPRLAEFGAELAHWEFFEENYGNNDRTCGAGWLQPRVIGQGNRDEERGQH